MSKKSKLKRKLSFWDGASLIVANVIGIGIFTTPGIVAGMVSDTGSFMLVWIAGGIFALIGAAAYSDLSTLMPTSGGEYIYLKKAFGPLWGFLSGWTSFVAGFPGAIAASSIGFAAYAEDLFQNTDFGATVEQARLFSFINNYEAIAIGIIVLLTMLHLLKISVGKRIQNGLTILSVITILVLVGTGLFSYSSSSVEELNFTASSLASTPGNWLLALIPVLFTYSGWNAAVYVAEEIKNPGKNMSRAMFTGTGLVILLYLLLNLVYVVNVPLNELSGSINITSLVSERLFNRGGEFLVVIVILAALISSISAMIMTGPRVYFAMARDGVFPRSLNKVDPNSKTPSASILIQSIWSIALILTGTFEQLLTYTGFAIVLFSSLSVLALLKMKGKELLNKPARLACYVLFIAAGLVMTINAVIRSPLPSLGGVAMILAGVPVYYWFMKRKSSKKFEI